MKKIVFRKLATCISSNFIIDFQKLCKNSLVDIFGQNGKEWEIIKPLDMY